MPETVSEIDEVRYIAEIARECWEPLWPGWKALTDHPNPNAEPASQDACIPTSFALRFILDRCIKSNNVWYWRVCGGRPTSKTPMGGYLCPDGKARGHLWVVGRNGRGKAILVDITADQFGGPKVVVEPFIPDQYVDNISRKLVKKYENSEGFHISMWIETLVHALKIAAEMSPDQLQSA